MPEKIKKIPADLSENRLNLGNFITILHKNSGKLSIAPPGKHQPRTPMYPYLLGTLFLEELSDICFFRAATECYPV
jgi:hypothetical protein